MAKETTVLIPKTPPRTYGTTMNDPEVEQRKGLLDEDDDDDETAEAAGGDQRPDGAGSICGRCWRLLYQCVQTVLGCAIFLVCSAITVHSIGAGDSVIRIPPLANFALLSACLTAIGYLEGYHVTLVVLEKVSSSSLEQQHPRAAAVHSLATKSAHKFLVGRQVLLTGLMFLTANITKFECNECNVSWLPEGLIQLLLETGLAGSVVVLVIGSLTPQLVAASFPVYHYGLPGGYYLVSLALLVERSGVAEVSSFLSDTFCRWMRLEKDDFSFGSDFVFQAAGHVNPEGEPQAEATECGTKEPSAAAQPMQCSWKVVFSSLIGIGTLGMGLWYMFSGDSYLCGKACKKPVVTALALLVLLGLLLALSLLEGMNIATLALEKVPPEEIHQSRPQARQFLKNAMSGDSVRRFLIGRQFLVVYCDFIVFQLLGLWGSVPVILIAQVFPQLAAASSPVSFVEFFGARVMFWACRVTEATGVGHAGWILTQAVIRVNACVSGDRGDDETFAVGKAVSIKSA